MPNWCVGTLKVRGEKDDVKRFLTGAFSPMDSGAALASIMGGAKTPPKTIEVSEDEWSLTLNTQEGFYVKGTRRNFIESTEIEWYFEREILVIENYQAAWGIEAEPLRSLSDTYHVDLKIYAFERGMEFNQDIEIHKGIIVKNDEIKFSDYQWECIMPYLGG